MKVLITAPSLDENENVSGISTMISSIIESAPQEFSHFTAGRKDGDKFDVDWFVTQIKLPFAFRKAIAQANPQIIHINTAFEPRAIIRDLVLAKSAGNKPIVLHVHGGRFLMEDFTSRALELAANNLLRSATHVIALSDIERDRFLERMPDLNVSVLPNAVSTANFPDTERAPGTKNIVYHGRLHRVKGLNDMVEACRQLTVQGFKFRFTSYGTGPDEEAFVTDMSKVMGDNYHHRGVITAREKTAALAEADIFLLPSRTEGVPIALLEAMAAGCVPVVSNCGGIASVVEDGRNGFLVDPGDLTQIVGKLKFLLCEGETGWDDYRRNARETIRSLFDIADYPGKLNAIYSEVSSRT